MDSSISPVNAGTKILVTGGTGFVGAYILKELVDNGYYVRAIRRNQKIPFFIPVETIEQVEWIEADILDIPALETAMESIDIVIHAAAKVSFAADEKQEMFRTNIDGTTNMVNIAMEKQIKKLVYISSVATLGRPVPGKIIDEGNPWDAIKTQSHYAASKYHAEMEVWRAIGEGLNAIILNPSTVIGYGDWNNSSCAIFKNVFNEFPWYTNGSNGFVDVKDLASAVLLLMQSDINAERFLISSENWSFRELFNQIADGFSKKHPTLRATPMLGGIAWRLEKWRSMFTGKPSILTRETAAIAQANSYFDSAKIRSNFPGFRFTPLSESIRLSCLAYLKNLDR